MPLKFRVKEHSWVELYWMALKVLGTSIDGLAIIVSRLK